MSEKPEGFTKSCRTSAKKLVVKTSWIIDNFKFCEQDMLESIKFCADGTGTWHYQLYRSVIGNLQSDFNLYIKIDSSPKRSTLFLKTEVIDAYNRRKTKETRSSLWAGESSYLLQLERNFVFPGMLTINVEVCIVEKVECLPIETDPPIAQPEPELIPDLARLLEDPTFSDVTIAVGDKEFQAHKTILAARSKVFAAMFTHVMIESKRNRVVIGDVEPKVFAELLRFIYTDSVQELDSMALELLQVADRYDLGTLRAMCERSLGAHICEESAIETLITADLYRADQLKRATIEFIQRNVKILSSDKWKDFWRVNFDLANEVLIRLISK